MLWSSSLITNTKEIFTWCYRKHLSTFLLHWKLFTFWVDDKCTSKLALFLLSYLSLFLRRLSAWTTLMVSFRARCMTFSVLSCSRRSSCTSRSSSAKMNFPCSSSALESCSLKQNRQKHIFFPTLKKKRDQTKWEADRWQHWYKEANQLVQVKQKHLLS